MHYCTASLGLDGYAQPVVLEPHPERRHPGRLKTGACVACRADASLITGVGRNSYFVYFRCSACGYVVRIVKPGSAS